MISSKSSEFIAMVNGNMLVWSLLCVTCLS